MITVSLHGQVKLTSRLWPKKDPKTGIPTNRFESQTITLWKKENGSQLKGRCAFHFEFLLPIGVIPHSIQKCVTSVQYFVVARIHKSFVKLDSVARIPIQVLSYDPFESQPTETNFCQQVEGFSHSYGLISGNVFIDRCKARPNETVKVVIAFKNESVLPLKSASVKLIEQIEYQDGSLVSSTGYIRASTTIKPLPSDRDGTYDCSLIIPSESHASLETNHLKIRFCVKVTLKYGKLFVSDVQVFLPIQIRHFIGNLKIVEQSRQVKYLISSKTSHEYHKMIPESQ